MHLARHQPLGRSKKLNFCNWALVLHSVSVIPLFLSWPPLPCESVIMAKCMQSSYWVVLELSIQWPSHFSALGAHSELAWVQMWKSEILLSLKLATRKWDSAVGQVTFNILMAEFTIYSCKFSKTYSQNPLQVVKAIGPDSNQRHRGTCNCPKQLLTILPSLSSIYWSYA